MSETKVIWHPLKKDGLPPFDGWYFLTLELDGERAVHAAYYDACMQEFSVAGFKESCVLVAWAQAPKPYSEEYKGDGK